MTRCRINTLSRLRERAGVRAFLVRSRAFTLIELLVVVGIIALLLGVLVPTLSAARESARTVQCLSNLRQMAVASQAYCTSNGGYFPVAYWKVSANPVFTSYSWDYTRITDVSTGVTSVTPGLLWQSTDMGAVQQCPGYDGKSNSPGDPYTGYNYNTSYIGHGQQEAVPAPLRLSMVRRASSCAIFGDGEFIGGANKYMRAPFPSAGDASFSSRAAGAQGFRHGGKTNVVFVDGHAQTLGLRHAATDPAQAAQLTPRIGFLSPDNSAYDPG